ncbi:NAD(+)/NADH kinase, partial [Patescibacteria group bacterium]|nr:NAD(+)/NADH kinase [Patescibacteria group bacterium]
GLNKPFIGWHRGNRYSQGFLLNPPTKEYLEEYISNQIAVNNIPMLKIELFDGKEVNLGVRYGFGDCYFKGAQGSGFMHARVIIDGEIWFDQLDGDGVLVCTAAGSTAYNASNYGPIETLDFEDLIVNAICPTLWCNWRPRILDRSQTVTLETLHTERRAVNLWIDGHFIDLPVQKIKVSQAKKTVALCFVKSYNFREKVEKLKLQRTKEV